MDETKEYLQQKLNGIKVDAVEYNPFGIESAGHVLEKVISESACINITGGTKLESATCLQAAQKLNILSVYVYMAGRRIILFENDRIKPLSRKFEDLSVEELFSSSGTVIIEHKSKIYEKPVYKLFLDFILNNYQGWKLVNRVLKNKHAVSHSCVNHLSYGKGMLRKISWIYAKDGINIRLCRQE